MGAYSNKISHLDQGGDQPKISAATPRLQLNAMAKSFTSLKLGDIPTFSNLSMKIYDASKEPSSDPEAAKKQRDDAMQAGRELANLIATYRGTPMFETMQTMATLPQQYKQLVDVNTQESGISGKTNRQVMDEHMKEMGKQFGLDPNIGMDGYASKGFQLSMRLNMLTDMLKDNIDKLHNETDPQKLNDRQARVENSKAEIDQVINSNIDSFKGMAKMLQNPSFLRDLSPQAATVARQMGEEYGKLTLAMTDPAGPAQGLLALSNLAVLDGGAAHALIHA